ncbi:MAG: potassium channel protein [Anaerolineae bacterium]|nr:potassium channel protein [Anaerolineae bacterium]
MTDPIKDLKGHYILCGAGRTGFHIAEELYHRRIPLVVVEHHPDVIAALKARLPDTSEGVYFIEGDATEDEALLQAGIKRAKGLFTAMGDDKDNLFVILSARSLSPRIRIVTRVDDERLNRSKMEKAGADKVISTNAIGGLRAASEMIRPSVVRFLDQMVHVSDKSKTLRFTELPLVDIRTPELAELIKASQLDGEHAHKLTIKDIGRYTGLLVVAIKSLDQEDYGSIAADEPDDFLQRQHRYRFTPRGDVGLEINDVLVVIGTQDKLDEVTGRR